MNLIVLNQPLREYNKITKIVNIDQASSMPGTILNGLQLMQSCQQPYDEVYSDPHFTNEETERREVK